MIWATKANSANSLEVVFSVGKKSSFFRFQYFISYRIPTFDYAIPQANTRFWTMHQKRMV
ncbi:hypothetical protein BpHYR1_048151 [Brachionus plicatilis]|uniref:Uncharacterized protein n=1 Tax=Brachionus plicatilis TaxID=10195 RepID=A0A3M7QSD9_BRAPC|nr:hypothetical protein BpHYR1_048151 [Brachionus plicatilis]